MDQEMNFPNPVTRTDLPTRRRRWPRVLLGIGVLALLTVVFLPQILSSKVGRKLVVSYLSSKTNSAVTLESFQTSWFGGTTVRFLSIPDPMGRRIGFKSLTCKASLWNLLRGKYRLGETVIEGLNVDYVVDDGRGADTLDRFKAPPAGEGGATAAAAPATDAWPELSGKITVNSGTINLIRGTVQPKLFNVTWEQAKLENMDATFEIAALDRPWTYTVSADTVEEGGERGTITSSGTVALGDVKRLKLDATLSGEKVRTGPLGAALIPGATPADVRQALGPVLGKVDLVVKAADGKLTFERCEATGPFAQVRARPTIDLATTPAVLELAGPEAGVISTGISKRCAAAWLVYLNPFFREAVDGKGRVTLTVDKLRLPLGRQWARAAVANGRLTAKGLTLDRNDEMSTTEPLPDNLASQLALLTGDAEQGVVMDADGPFEIAGGNATVGPMETTIHGTTMMVSGVAELESGTLREAAAVTRSPEITSVTQATPGKMVMIPIGGTVRKPQLGVSNVLADVPAFTGRTNEQISRMRAKDTQRLMQKSQAQVQEILRPLQGPATMPAGK